MFDEKREVEWLLTEKYDGEKTEGFFADVAKLEAGEPLAYLIGHIPFLNTTISLDSHPLIPRVETEYWVEKAIAQMRSAVAAAFGAGHRVLDLCAGSGCIGVAVLAALPEAQVDFAELEPAHHATILKNIKENNIDQARARILGGDLFAEVAATYDFILTNPPYIDPAIDRVTESVRTHEPSIALYGGVHGMELIARIIAEAPAHLAPGGSLYIEHEPEQTDEISRLAPLAGLTATTYPDQYDTPRYTVCTRKK